MCVAYAIHYSQRQNIDSNAEREREAARTNGIMQQPRVSFLHTRQPAQTMAQGSIGALELSDASKEFPSQKPASDRFSQIPSRVADSRGG